nr:MAG: putative capsid protein [Canine stool-associated circular virus]
MAYGRRRYYRKRYNRSRKSSLSNYSIATRTSARSQATQIWRLKKRINAIQRRTKPEIRVSQPSSVIYEPTGSSTTGYGWASRYYINPNALQGSGGVATEGYMCRLLSGTVYFNANYTNISATVQPITYRVTIIQTIAGLVSSEINFEDIFNYDTDTTGPAWTPSSGVTINTSVSQTSVFGPLQNNITRSFRVLSDRKFVLSYQRPQINRVIKFKPSTIFSSSNTGQKGAIYVCVAAYAPSNQHTYRVASKLALTDS